MGYNNELEICNAKKWIKEINNIDRQPTLMIYIGCKNKFCQKNILNVFPSENINAKYPFFRVNSYRIGIATG